MNNILVVDDEPSILELIKEALNDEYNVLTAESASDAFKIATDNTIDLIVSDLVMPDKNGIDMIMEFKKNEPDIKILAISGGGGITGRFDYLPIAKLIGAENTLKKPFTMSELKTSIIKIDTKMLKKIKDYDLLEHLYECSTICILDDFFSIVFSNKNFNTLIGYNENELDGSSLLQITHHDQSNSIYNFPHKKSQLVWLDTVIKPITSHSKQVRYLASFIDISHQKQLIDNVKQRAHRQCLIAILGQISLNNIPIQDLIEQTLSVACGSLNKNIGIILEIKDHDKSAIVRAGYNTNYIISEKTIISIKSDNVLNHTIHSSQPIHCELKENSTSGIFFLIGDKKSPFGIFILLSNQSKTLNIDETYFLQSICNIIAESNNRQLMEKNIRHERELLRSYLDVAEVVFFVVDTNKNIILVNHHAAKISGYTQEEIKGTNFIEILIPETHKKTSIINFNNKINKINVTNEMETNTHTYGNVTPIITKQKTMRYIRWRSSSLLDENENVEYILYAGEDITEILKHELEEKNLQKLLYQAQKTEAIGLLAGSIAHDFNNILASILGFSELALEKTEDSNKKLIKYLNKIKDSGIKGRNIIDQMQHLNLQEDTPNNTILLPSLLKSTLQILHSTLPSSINIQSDITKIMHLLSNSNTALNGQGIIKISMNINKIHNQNCTSCGEPINDKYVVLTIHDNGPGIDKALLNNIFSSDKKEFNSGLEFVSNISHEKQGHLVISNKKLHINDKNEGACIELLFKIINYESENEQHDKNSIDFSKIHHKHIMIVDDESTVASYMGELFNSAGFLSHVFSDPVQAYNEFEMNPEKFDLIISDLTMPAITGDILASKMLKINPELPFIICTGYEDLLSKEKVNDLQIQALFKKPVDSAELLHTVVSLLTKSNNTMQQTI